MLLILVEKLRMKSVDISIIVTCKVTSLVKSGRKKEVTANLVTFTEDAHNKKLHFLCSDSEYWED